jgi:hypothetical protein
MGRRQSTNSDGGRDVPADWTAIANKQPISAIVKDLPRLFCPHRLGRSRLGQPRVLCYQYGGESESGLGR